MNNNSNHSEDGCLWMLIKLPFVLLRFFIGWSITVFVRLPLIFIAGVSLIFLRDNKLSAWIIEFDEEYIEEVNKWMWGLFYIGDLSRCKVEFKPVAEVIPDYRAVFEELFTFIPYFECRINGTFKKQYMDCNTGKLLDFEGCEETNKSAQFDDPVYDETWCRFQRLIHRNLLDKLPPLREIALVNTKKPTTNEKIYKLLHDLCYDTTHERMCTGYTASCMANGRYLNELKQLQQVLEEV